MRHFRSEFDLRIFSLTIFETEELRNIILNSVSQIFRILL